MSLHFIYVLLGFVVCGGFGHYLAGGKGMWLAMVVYLVGLVAGALWA